MRADAVSHVAIMTSRCKPEKLTSNVPANVDKRKSESSPDSIVQIFSGYLIPEMFSGTLFLIQIQVGCLAE